MRKVKKIREDGSRPEILSLEVLLDIREILIKATKKKKNKLTPSV